MVFKILTEKHIKSINELLKSIEKETIADTAAKLHKIIERVREDIPDKKRISYGRYNIIKEMGIEMYPMLREKGINILYLFGAIYEDTGHEPFVRSLSIQLLTIYALSDDTPETVLPFLEKAAMDEEWTVRECSAGFVRKLIVKYPDAVIKWYMKMVSSKDPMQRRFACESLRPVADNGWFKKRPEFAFSIISKLYTESDAYPRTSIGNALSDWMRIDEKRTLEIVRNLAENGNKNSYWIAYRACRNLVKKEPLLVMDILGVDHYKYKDRNFYREQFQK